jgi:hypothetical protein
LLPSARCHILPGLLASRPPSASHRVPVAGETASLIHSPYCAQRTYHPLPRQGSVWQEHPRAARILVRHCSRRSIAVHLSGVDTINQVSCHARARGSPGQSRFLLQDTTGVLKNTTDFSAMEQARSNPYVYAQCTTYAARCYVGTHTPEYREIPNVAAPRPYLCASFASWYFRLLSGTTYFVKPRPVQCQPGQSSPNLIHTVGLFSS